MMADGLEPIPLLFSAKFIYEPLIFKACNHKCTQAMEILMWHEHLGGEEKKTTKKKRAR